MRKLVLKMSLSTDGFTAGPNGEIDWLLKTTDDSAVKWVEETLWEADVHIMGSRTFHDMAAYWPSSNDPLAAPMNEIPKIVFSKKGLVNPKGIEQTTRALKDATRHDKEKGILPSPSATEDSSTWINFHVAGGDLADEISALKKQEGKIILAHGGAGFARSLVSLGLIDEFRLLIHPVVLGKGLPLFSSLENPVFLNLLSSVKFKSGIIANIYTPEGN